MNRALGAGCPAPGRGVRPTALRNLLHPEARAAPLLEAAFGREAPGAHPGEVDGIEGQASAQRELYEVYARFVAALREAAEQLQAGNRQAASPAGSFPPAPPWVGG